MRNARHEQMFSGLSPIADVSRTRQRFRVVAKHSIACAIACCSRGSAATVVPRGRSSVAGEAPVLRYRGLFNLKTGDFYTAAKRN
jgi:hypothetical protein